MRCRLNARRIAFAGARHVEGVDFVTGNPVPDPEFEAGFTQPGLEEKAVTGDLFGQQAPGSNWPI